MKPILSSENKNIKTKGEKMVEKAEKRIKKAHKDGYAIFCSGNYGVDFKKLRMDF